VFIMNGRWKQLVMHQEEEEEGKEKYCSIQ
jgi:hypothetical protein